MLLLLLILAPWTAGADESESQVARDASVRVAGRTLPFGGIVSGTLGVSLPLWKADESGSSGPKWRYGYIRTAAVLETAAVVNRAKLELDVFPVSIAGVTFGRELGIRLTDRRGFDCEQFRCRGRLDRWFAQPKLLVGYGPVFLSVTGRVDWLSHSEAGLPFVDELSVLSGAPGADRLRTLMAVAGVKVDEEWTAGVLATASRMQQSDQSSSFVGGVARVRRGRWTATAGAGWYDSTPYEGGPSMLALLEWAPLPGPGLF